MRRHPRVLGVDDAPFTKRQAGDVPIVGVVMEGALLVEGVAISAFPVDGDDATGFLEAWIRGMRWYPALQAVVLGGVTLAGLGLVDVVELAVRLGRPVIAVTRRSPADSDLAGALEKAGFPERRAILDRIPAAVAVADGLHASFGGTSREEAAAILRATLRSGRIPEPLRVAHLVAAALVRGTSRGRV